MVTGGCGGAYGDKCVFSCKHGYTLSIITGDAVRTCGLGGSYSGTTKPCGRVIDGHVDLEYTNDAHVCKLMDGVFRVNGNFNIHDSASLTSLDCLQSLEVSAK